MSDAVKIIFGCMTFGKPNTLGARIHDVTEAGALLDLFQKHGHNELDTARVYGTGSCELMLSQLDLDKRGMLVATKCYPTARSPMKSLMTPYTHKPEDLRRSIMESLTALNAKSVDLFYLHGPDREVPFVETLREVNAMHKEGLFRRFGLSNFMSWEVAQICELCRSNGWIQPSVYQGIYHALQRSIEPELIPCLRHYGLSLYAFQPLAGGFLTGRYTRKQEEFEPGSRFDPNIWQGQLHRDRYWSDTYFDALEMIHDAAQKHTLTDSEVALRWLKHHSKLNAGAGDGIIIGASSAKHLEGNLTALEKGPLPEDVVQVLEKAWLKVKGVAPKYWH